MPATTVRHKHVRIDQKKLTKAKSVLGCATETEAIEKALDFVLAEDEILRTLRRIKGKGRFRKIFD